jgi:hypothetical protein
LVEFLNFDVLVFFHHYKFVCFVHDKNLDAPCLRAYIFDVFSSLAINIFVDMILECKLLGEKVEID